jgi:hypothetical protein
MPRPLDTQPPAQPDQPDAPIYHYDPNLGGARDKYTRADLVHLTARQPEVPARFVAVVEGETVINTMWGRRTVAWRAQPGTPCIIQGYWSDGTVHLRWPAIGGHYSVDGRFPAWVVAVDETAILAGGGRILSANDPSARRAGPSARVVFAAVMLLAVILLLALPPTRDALGDALGVVAGDLLQLTH